jgi:hypothetical protein
MVILDEKPTSFGVQLVKSRFGGFGISGQHLEGDNPLIVKAA